MKSIIHAAIVHYAGLLLNWLLIAALAFAAIVGILFITRGTAVRRVRGVGSDGKPVAPSDDSFPVCVSLLTGSALVDGNRVDVVLDGDLFPRLWHDLRAARTSITVQMYYAEPGRVTDTLADILVERALSGVHVYALYDAFGAKSLGGSYAERLRSAGAKVIAFRPLRLANLWISRTAHTSEE